MQPPGFARPCHLAGPDIQSAGLLTVQQQFLKAFLHPLPTLHLLLPSEPGNGGMLLGITLEQAWADKIHSIRHGMYERLGVVDDEPPRQYVVLEP